MNVALVTSIPAALLVIVQYMSPVSAAINKGLTDDVEGRFTVIADLVRPYGVFTFVTGQAVYAAFMLALIFIAFDRQRAWGINKNLLWLATLATVAMGTLSGSRTFFLSAGIIAGSVLMGGVAAGRGAALWRQVLVLGGAFALFAGSLTVVFPTALAAILQRQADAVASEGSTAGRAASLFSPTSNLGPPPSILGEGIGVGSNAGAFLLTGNREFLLAENEIPRVIQETGVIGGTVTLIFRVILILWIANCGVQAARRTESLSSFALLGVAAAYMFAGQVSAQNQLVSFAWLIVGLAASLTRPSVLESGDPQSQHS